MHSLSMIMPTLFPTERRLNLNIKGNCFVFFFLFQMYSACVVSRWSSDPAVGAFFRIYTSPSQFYEMMLPMGTDIKDFSSYYQIACLCRASDPSELQIIILTEENIILSQLAPIVEAATITNVFRVQKSVITSLSSSKKMGRRYNKGFQMPGLIVCGGAVLWSCVLCFRIKCL